ncbi:MAG: energy-coupling factor transporter ATPase [Clostridia bacterium]|nr:energy-coupling factor transporter ATPase [Clostridia bacterium]MBQ5758153.1 energy-coupling factor transporter ATPase [Clostridia bacterium]
MSIVFEKVSHCYLAESSLAFKALSSVSLTIEEGCFTGIIGHTGSGKSTFLQHLNGLLLPSEGTVTVDGLDTKYKANLKQIRSRVGIVFQYPEYQLFEETVLKDVMFGPKNMGLSEDECRDRAVEALEQVGLNPKHFSDQSPFDLSGGEKRRAALAGVLAMKPKYLALDEPMAGLDPCGRKEIMALLSHFQKDLGCTVIMVSHSMDDIAKCAEHVIVLDRGSVVMSGTPREIFSREEELEKLSLSVPQVVKLTHLLIKNGMDLPSDIITPSELASALLGEVD